MPTNSLRAMNIFMGCLQKKALQNNPSFGLVRSGFNFKPGPRYLGIVFIRATYLFGGLLKLYCIATILRVYVITVVGFLMVVMVFG